MADHAVVTRAYYQQPLDQTPKGRQDEFLAIRSDEYPES